MKRLLNILVAVATSICILISTTVPAFATEFEDDVLLPIDFLDENGNVVFTVQPEDFDVNDYAFSYDFLINPPNTMSLTGSILGFSGLAWSGAFADLGLICSSGAMFFLGYSLCGDMIVKGVSGFCKDLLSSPAQFFNFVSVVMGGLTKLSPENIEMLENCFTAWMAGDPVVIPKSLSEATADVINGLSTTDSGGNVYDSSIIFNTEYIGGVFESTYPYTNTMSRDSEYLLGTLNVGTTYNSTFTVDCLTYTKDIKGDLGSFLEIKNDLTGSILHLSIGCWGAKNVYHVSMPYKYLADDGSSFWLQYYTSNSFVGLDKPGSSFTPNKISSSNPIVFYNTGTVLDGQSVVSCTWDAENAAWLYTFATGVTTLLAMDPLGIILSNTGVNTTGKVDTVNVDANTTDLTNELTVATPVADVKSPAIGVPITDVLADALAIAIAGALAVPFIPADVIALAPGFKLDTPDDIRNFIGNIANFFDGIFDWLPDDFRDSLDFVMGVLQGIVFLMITVKVIGLLWPG